MNWKRGLIRLWAIISLLWLFLAIGAAFLISAKHQEQTVEPSSAEIAKCANSDDLKCGLVEVEQVTVWQLPPWQVFLGIAAVPVLLFGVGLAGYWVARGFAASK